MGLLSQLAEKEQVIAIRRRRIAGLAEGLEEKMRSAAVAPGALLVAVGVGVVVEQTGRRRVSSLANTLNALNIYGTALFALSALKNRV